MPNGLKSPDNHVPACVLLISLYPSHPQIGGRMSRLYQLAKAIRHIGFRPILLYQDFAGGNLQAMRDFWGSDLKFVPYRRDKILWNAKRLFRQLFTPSSKMYRMGLKLQKLVGRCLQKDEEGDFCIRLDDLYDDALSCHIREICERERPKAAICLDVFLSKSLEQVPGSSLRILDASDVFAVGRQPATESQEKLWVDLSLEDELRGYRRADLVWAIQSKDEETIRRTAPDLNVGTVGHTVELFPPDYDVSLRSKEILLVATKHKWNVQGLRWFASEVYPLLRDTLPEKNVVVAGDIAHVLGAEMPFKFLGRVADVGAIYTGVRAVFSPIRGGAGLKIKNIEPMGYGKAVVSTRFAALGLEAAENRAYLVADDPAGFASAIRQVMQDDALCRKLMRGAFEFAREYNQEVFKALRTSLDGQRRPAHATTAC